MGFLPEGARRTHRGRAIVPPTVRSDERPTVQVWLDSIIQDEIQLVVDASAWSPSGQQPDPPDSVSCQAARRRRTARSTLLGPSCRVDPVHERHLSAVSLSP
jgi:hypothetical protein